MNNKTLEIFFCAAWTMYFQISAGYFGRSCSAETCWSKIDILNVWFTLKMHFVGFSFIITGE
jgi:hypothetical protein